MFYGSDLEWLDLADGVGVGYEHHKLKAHLGDPKGVNLTVQCEVTGIGIPGIPTDKWYVSLVNLLEGAESFTWVRMPSATTEIDVLSVTFQSLGAFVRSGALLEVSRRCRM